ncbi:MAG: TetR/AcrR family transcriptional regulator [Zoogloeaceae bacterium]|jgi:AcrR family transcriptional regulator|nr:TetR/AcrR family transcriptional regulator [Zoogloeaceae bacterium]
MNNAAPPRAPANAKRQDILETALRLFQTNGYQAVGINCVIEESGVAKMTMYKYFASKDALIEAVLQERDTRFRQALEQFVARFPDPPQRLRAVFLWHHRWFCEPTFHGCMFINAAVEFPDPGHPARQVALTHKTWLKTYVGALLAALLTTKVAERLALQCARLLDGATVAAQLSGDPAAAFLAWNAVVSLLRQEGVAIEPGEAFDDVAG